MPDPKLEEFTRARELQHHVFRNLQAYVRDVVQPKLDKYEQLIEVEIPALEAQIRALKKEGDSLRAPDCPTCGAVQFKNPAGGYFCANCTAQPTDARAKRKRESEQAAVS